MKLESLKKDKFAPFKENEITNLVKITGGEGVATCLHGQQDTRDYDTTNTGHTDGAGRPWDFYIHKKPCLTDATDTL